VAPGYNMPAVIANDFGEASGVFRAALMGMGVLLFIFTIIINVIARGVVERSARREPTGRRRTSNGIATALMVLAFVLVIIPLGFVIFTVIAKGASIISWSFLTGSIPPQVAPANVGGIGPAVVGTIEITALATVMAVPIGILGAVYLNEYGGKGP